MNDTLRRFAFIAAFGFTTAASAAPSKQESVDQPRDCLSGVGQGLSAAPSDETKALTAALLKAGTLSIDDLMVGVSKGEPAAIAELGIRYANGKDVPQNINRATELFAYLAQSENVLGQYFMGVAYANGAGVPASDEKAVILWDQSARQGYANAQYWLGFMIANGRGGISPDWCTAIPLFLASADVVSDSAFMLGLAYHTGEFGIVDHEKAAYWYRKADKVLFNQKAQYNLRILIEAHHVKWQEGDPGVAPPPPSAPSESNTETAPTSQNAIPLE